MIFNSPVFLFAFLPVVFALFWLARTKQQRYILLTASGYIFYGYWDWRFCFLLLLSSLVSFTAGLAIEHAASRRAKRAWMVGSISFDLAVLGFFKYYNFFAANVQHLAPAACLPHLHVLLPIGISFYTFHTITYIADVAAGRVRPTHHLFEYLAYVSLFPQLVAGPIVRFRQIEADLEHIDRAPREDQQARGLGFFVVGLIKKAVIADTIARCIDPLLKAPAALSMTGAWLAALGYALQIYYDFSGYSDMAVGLGHLFGLRIPQNFNAPYRAEGLRDFWRRWHISLSTCLRDYLYIPLGGNRRGGLRTHVNLMITMLLGGLWHGANWTFVIWGAYHGVLLMIDRALEPWLQRWPRALYRGATFLLVLIGWVFFRSEHFTMAFTWLRAMCGWGGGAAGGGWTLWIMTILGLAAVAWAPETWDLRFGTTRRWVVLYALLFVAAYFFMHDRGAPFLYYQF